VITIAHWGSNAFGLKGSPDAFNTILVIIFSGYVFKLVVALVDTAPFYFGTHWLSNYLQIDPNEEYSIKKREGDDHHHFPAPDQF
jgi:uncharacterized PurR-regulated membrane protein YhhQ (DUF165 family)